MKKKKQKLLDLCLDGIIDKKEYVERREGIENEITSVEQSIAELPVLDEGHLTEVAERYAEFARGKLKDKSREEIQKFLRLIIDEMTYDYKTAKVRITFRVATGKSRSVSSQLSPALTSVNCDEILKLAILCDKV